MKFFIMFMGLYVVLAPLVSRFTSYLAEHVTAGGQDACTAHEVDELATGRICDEEWLDDSSHPGATFMAMDHHIGLDSACEINPANGLPMLGCLDVAGNAYGTDTFHGDDVFAGDSFSMWDDTFSSSSSSISSFDD